MRRTRFALGLGLAGLLLSPVAALAQNTVPDRLNGTFDFMDEVEDDENTLEFEVEGRAIGIEGQVRALTGSRVITITYETGFPSGSAASTQSASVSQDREVLITLEAQELGEPEPFYVGDATPNKCKADAKIRDNESNDPDDPDKSQAKLSCDLGSDWSEIENELSAPPPPDVLDDLEAAFASRKDVKVDTSSGKLQIAHKGVPVPAP